MNLVHGSRVPDIPVDAALAREALAKAGRLTLLVQGGSMGPWIRSGEQVTVEPVQPVQARRGDVLVFEREGGGALVAHRAVRRERRGWITRGDAIDHDDAWVSDERLVGRVADLHLRWLVLRRPPAPVRSEVGRLLLALSPAIQRLRRAR